jgi:exopolyphosphatase/guanosine-5'-triphosphate,3'-diphosphate pyrophosphatase
MRIAAIDIGSNSTRLLVADVSGGRISELFRRSVVTRLGDRVDASGVLDPAACDRVYAVIEQYRSEFEEAGAERVRGVATSAVRDAANGLEFRREILSRYGVEIDVIGGDKEAQLTFAGASLSGAVHAGGRGLVVDIGGGSTEFIVGDGGELTFHVSTKMGAVRQSERHLHHDPPTAQELAALLDEGASIISASVPAEFRDRVSRGIAVAGTPTVLASVDQKLEVFDPWKVHGYAITRAACERMLAMLGGMPLSERREVVGLHPDRAPTIVAGAAILLATMDAFDLLAIEVSEHDILYGLALEIAAG